MEHQRDMDDEEAIDPREEARIQRRDHDAEAHHRELLRPGMAKVYKQMTDAIGKEPEPRPKHAHKTRHRDG